MSETNYDCEESNDLKLEYKNFSEAQKICNRNQVDCKPDDIYDTALTAIIQSLDDQIIIDPTTASDGTVKKSNDFSKVIDVIIYEPPSPCQHKSSDKIIELSKNDQPQSKWKKSDDNILMDYSILEVEEKCCTESTSYKVGRKAKKGKYYYSQPESNLLKDIKKLFKTKFKRKTCTKEVENCPENDCRIKVEAWERHDKDKDYKLVGKLLFPVYSKELFYQEPGVVIRNSQKSYTLNDPDKFGKPELEKRKYAYPEKIIPVSGLDWEADDLKEMEEWIDLQSGTVNQIASCNTCSS